ncbi:MAG: hypothetical protein CMG04_09185, partial [Candidatus Marinimicrobia bacterium]|nr:hypothetical protein [Candidatus Neomarinimicrobiota bacterium]
MPSLNDTFLPYLKHVIVLFSDFWHTFCDIANVDMIKNLKKGKHNMKTLLNNKGNSLAEFAVVIALMATLAATGQVK